MGTVDCRIDRYIPVDVTGSVGLGKDLHQHAIPGAIDGVSTVPLPHCLPRTEPLWEIPPRDPGPIPVDNALDHPAIVFERTAFPALVGGE